MLATHAIASQEVAARRHAMRGTTLLEILIVLAIIGMGAFLARAGYRAVTKAQLAEATIELIQLMRQASNLALSTGEMHRLVVDLDRQGYAIEACTGVKTVTRGEPVVLDPEERQRMLAKAAEKLRELPPDAFAAGDPEAHAARAAAIAGKHLADRTCEVANDPFGKQAPLTRQLPEALRFRKLWVQHQQDVTEKGQVAIFFYPSGAAEKAVVVLSDGGDAFSVLVHGLSGRVELRDGEVRNPEDHMMRNLTGERDAKREVQR